MARQLFGLFEDPRVYVLTSPVSEAAIGSMSAREAAAMRKVAEKRRREFATARVLAREGLERFFDIRDFDLLNAEDRSPIWPRGITGSISHCSTRAWVALVEERFGAIGIDGEDRDELRRDLWYLTLVEDEIVYLDSLDASIRGRRALALFAAKEALYKAQYPRSRLFMAYKALRVDLSENGSLRCTFREEVGPFPKRFVAAGRWTDEEDGIVAAVWIPASQP